MSLLTASRSLHGLPRCAVARSMVALSSRACTAAPALPSVAMAAPRAPPATAALHTASHRLALFGTPEEKAAKKLAAEHEAMRKHWKSFCEVLLRDKFDMNSYQEIIRMQSGEAAEGASWVDRTKAAVGQKLRSWQGGEHATPAELKDLAAMLAELTPEEKADARNITAETKHRVVEKTGRPVGDVNLMLDRFDQFLAMSEWFRWTRRTARPMPVNMADMHDKMKFDRHVSKMPRESKMDRRMKAIGRPSVKRKER